MIRLGLLGSSGRMGALISQLVATEFPHDFALKIAARRGDPLEPLLESDLVIDVSLPPVMSQLATLAIQKGKGLPKFVVGSTGWTPEGSAILDQLARLSPVLVSSNFSPGIHLVSSILKDYSPLLEKLGYHPILIEKHHRHKKDAPSGTAKTLQRTIDPKNPDRIQTHSIRAGEIIGDHEVSFYSRGDVVTLSHHAQDRSIFARGALEVARWLHQNPSSSPRVLGMNDYFQSIKSLIKGV